jgi:glutathione synthase/RimK-type ligase-like ATP-grasp enzyme
VLGDSRPWRSELYLAFVLLPPNLQQPTAHQIMTVISRGVCDLSLSASFSGKAVVHSCSVAIHLTRESNEYDNLGQQILPYPMDASYFASPVVLSPNKSENGFRESFDQTSVSPSQFSNVPSLAAATADSGASSGELLHHNAIPTAVTISTPSLSAPPSVFILEGAGGTDKDPETGHRRDTLPIRDALIASGCACQVLQYQEETGLEARAHNDAVRGQLLAAEAVIARVNPGTLSASTQAQLDRVLVELAACGVCILSHPEVIRRMGAKDALVKIKDLRCGLADTAVYYTEQELRAGFCQTIAFAPRVIKQNRGSQGEGIWIVKLADESAYCQNLGDRTAGLEERLVLIEANDNHMESHTVGEFLAFCIHGRYEASGEWTSQGTGRYLEGGAAASAMLVDQRFLPRIAEGEIRCLMIGDQLVDIVHKKPVAGGVSATLQAGACYTTYPPDAPAFAKLVENFQQDLPGIMAVFGLADQPLPLLWTADYILGTDAAGEDTFTIGEFNCSCVGITQGLARASVVGDMVVKLLARR